MSYGSSSLTTPVGEMSVFTLPFDSVDETPSGVFEKQTTASAQKGKKIFETVLNALVSHIELLKKTRMEDLMLKPKV